MSEAPTVHELARDQARIEAMQERDRLQARADRTELHNELTAGFAKIESMIGALSFVPREVYDQAMRQLDADIASLRDEVTSLRRVFIGGFLVVLAVAVIASALTP
jgi:hypothetical protein